MRQNKYIHHIATPLFFAFTFQRENNKLWSCQETAPEKIDEIGRNLYKFVGKL